MIFVKGKMYNFEPYNVLLAIVINIAVLLMTAFVLHIYTQNKYVLGVHDLVKKSVIVSFLIKQNPVLVC